jgi:hypothetical protein
MLKTFIAELFYLLVGITAFLGVFFFASRALAHTPLMACFDNGDDTVTCNGGFSDGSAAAGVSIRVVDEQDRVLLEGKMNSDSEYTFDRPPGAFTVVFDAGPGHVVKEKSSNID